MNLPGPLKGLGFVPDGEGGWHRLESRRRYCYGGGNYRLTHGDKGWALWSRKRYRCSWRPTRRERTACHKPDVVSHDVAVICAVVMRSLAPARTAGRRPFWWQHSKKHRRSVDGYGSKD